MSTRKAFEIGGLVTAVVLVAFGIAAIVMGFNGRSTVSDNLKAQQIVGTPDMTPSAITAEAKKAGLNTSKIAIPTCSVANKPINNGGDRPLLRAVHEHSRARGDRWRRLLADAALRDG